MIYAMKRFLPLLFLPALAQASQFATGGAEILLDEGKTPFDHVVLDNYKSMNLQRSLGMTLDEGFLYWYF